MLKQTVNYFTYKIKKTFLRNFSYEIWNIGIIKTTPDILLQLQDLGNSNITWLPPHKHFSYYADPFPYLHQNNFHIFAEEFSYFNKTGSICNLQISISTGDIIKKSDIFKNDAHHSYPLVFTEGKNIYMMPETTSKKELSLYKASNFPNHWQKTKVIISNKDVIDATLFHYEDYYWIFYTTKSKTHPQDSELHISYSKDLQSNFKDHPGNPVKIDSSSSRPAGKIFTHKEKIYRPSQDCSQTYGGGIVINEIIKLNPTEYIEKQVNRISMQTHPYYKDGIHTVNFCGEYMVFDAKRKIYSPLRIFVNIYRKARRFFRFFTVHIPIP